MNLATNSVCLRFVSFVISFIDNIFSTRLRNLPDCDFIVLERREQTTHLFNMIFLPVCLSASAPV